MRQAWGSELIGLTSFAVPARDKAVQPSIAVVFTTDHDAEAITISLRRSRAKRRLQARETYNLDQVLAEVESVVTQVTSTSARRASSTWGARWRRPLAA